MLLKIVVTFRFSGIREEWRNWFWCHSSCICTTDSLLYHYHYYRSWTFNSLKSQNKSSSCTGSLSFDLSWVSVLFITWLQTYHILFNFFSLKKKKKNLPPAVFRLYSHRGTEVGYNWIAHKFENFECSYTTFVMKQKTTCVSMSAAFLISLPWNRCLTGCTLPRQLRSWLCHDKGQLQIQH